MLKVKQQMTVVLHTTQLRSVQVTEIKKNKQNLRLEKTIKMKFKSTQSLSFPGMKKKSQQFSNLLKKRQQGRGPRKPPIS